jgi:glycerol-3-phosphate dehydrogenase
MGEDLGGGLTEIEARWMRDREWAKSAEDALMRRSKLGLHLTAADRDRIDRWWQENGV